MMTALAFIAVRATLDSIRAGAIARQIIGTNRDRWHGGGDLHRQILCSGDLLRR